MIKAFNQAGDRLGVVDGIINLFALTGDTDLFESEPGPLKRAVEAQFIALFGGLKALYRQWQDESRQPVVYVVSNTGGIFGYEKEKHGNSNLFGPLCAGFLKSLKKELPHLGVKAIDLTNLDDTGKVVDVLLDEFRRFDMPLEIGYTNRYRRKTIQVIPRTVDEIPNALPTLLNESDVIVCTGGGRGIVFECARGLARTFAATVIVTGRTALPSGSEPWIRMDNTEFKNSKPAFMQEMRTQQPTLTPVTIERQFKKLASARSLYQNLEECRREGLHVYYEACDANNFTAISELFTSVAKKYGRITGVIHGAGLESFGAIPKKPEEHTLEVIRTKANAFINLVRNARGQDLKFFINFGSISGRYGMDGQVDYAAGASLAVCCSHLLNRRYPDMKSFTLAWTAWADVGMAADENVRKIQEGIRGLQYLPPDEGVYRFLTELVYGGFDQEVIIAGKLGDNDTLGHNDLLDVDNRKIIKTISEDGIVLNRDAYPVVQRLESAISDTPCIWTKEVTVEEDMYLADHAIRGVPVVPGVMHIEGYMETARLMEASNTMEAAGCGLKDVAFERFLKCFPSNPLTLKYCGRRSVAENGDILFKVEIRSDFVNSHGAVLQRDLLNSHGTVVLPQEKRRLAKPATEVLDRISTGKELDLEKFYNLTNDIISFGPSFRYLDKAWYLNEDEIITECRVPDSDKLFSYTTTPEFMLCPILLDNAGRGVLLLHFHNHGSVVVPRFLSSAFKYQKTPGSGEKVYAYTRIRSIEDTFVRYDMQILDKTGTSVFLDIEDMTMIRIENINGDHSLFA